MNADKSNEDQLGHSCPSVCLAPRATIGTTWIPFFLPDLRRDPQVALAAAVDVVNERYVAKGMRVISIETVYDRFWFSLVPIGLRVWYESTDGSSVDGGPS